MKEMEIEEEKTVGQLINELELTADSGLLAVNGQIVYPFEKKDIKLKKEDKVLVIPVFEDG
jgi:sulfur carrier protein ThiS